MLKALRFEGTQMPAAAPDAAGLKWCKLFPFGSRFREDFPNGRIDFTPDFFKSMLANWERHGKPALPCDYLHRGDCEPDLPVEDKVAAGWIESLELRDDGLWGGFKWTKRAAEMIGADELRFLSPTFTTDGHDKLSGGSQGPTLFGAALLNTPFLQDLPRVAASNSPQSPPAAQEKKPMEFMAKLRTALGLGEAATEDECLAALTTKMATPPAPPAPTPPAPTVGMSAERVEEVVKLATDPLKVSLSELKAENVKLKAAAQEAAVTALTEKFRHKFAAAKRGKIAELAADLGIEKASKFLADLPDVVPLTEKGVAGDPAGDDTDASASKKYTDLVEQKAKESGLKFTEAARIVNRENPELANRANRLSSTKN